jgi:beta-alanine degradation protein BauB
VHDAVSASLDGDVGEVRTVAQRVTGPIGSKVLLDNDRVRVWELALQPGERSAVHEHVLDYLLIQVSGDRIAVDPEPDSQGEFREFFAADVIPGASIAMKRGGIETAVNVGSKPYLEVIVELKD